MTLLSFPLTLRRRDAPVRPAAAVFLPGRSVAEVVSAVASWPEDAATDAEFFALEPFGWLVVPKQPLTKPMAAGLAFGWIGNHLLVPVEADVHPPLAPEEADRAFERWERALWHPTLGARGWDRADAHRLADLLAMPRAGDRWNAAQPGPDRKSVV